MSRLRFNVWNSVCFYVFKVLIFFSILLSLPKFNYAQVCGTAGIDGPANSSVSVNTYFPPPANITLTTGSTSIFLGRVPGTDPHGNSFGSDPIRIGDLILLIQMQDAEINFSDNNRYGSNNPTSGPDGLGGTGFTNLNNTGHFEYVVSTSNVPITGGTLTFRGAGPGNGTVHTYVNAPATATRGQRIFQIIRVPQYSNLRLVSNISTPPFNGKVGGIIAFDVAGSMDFNGFTVDASARGFRGGYGIPAGPLSSGPNVDNVFVAPSSSTVTVGKGEGIAGTPRYMWDGYNQVDNGAEGLPGGSYGRGAPGNGGGAGNDHNAGGGGGGNGGFGGIGGNGWAGAGGNFPSGGRPGAKTFNTPVPDLTRVIMGGGGGGGDANDALTGVKGGVGGGIILVNIGKLVGNGTIRANGGEGAAGAAGNNPDGAGGGGAGGTVLIKISDPGVSTLNILARGGRGGHTLNDVVGNEHGPGGGGGGGLIFYTNPAPGIVLTDVSAGAEGRANSGSGIAHGAQAGTAGVATSFTNSNLPSYLQGGGSICYPELQTTMENINPTVVRYPGNTVTYVIRTTNVVPSGNAGGVQVEVDLPAGLTFQSANLAYTGIIGGPNPGPITNMGSSSKPVFGTFNIPPAGVITITLVASIDCNTAPGMYHASAQATYLDPTRTFLEPQRRITGMTNPFPGANTTYETGSAGNVIGVNYDGTLVTSTQEDVEVINPISPLDDVNLCATASTWDLPDAPANYSWGAAFGNPASASIHPVTGEITGMTANGIYRFSLRAGNSGCEEEVIITRATCPDVSFTIPTTTVYETQSQVLVTVDLNFASPWQVTVPYAISGTAEIPGDYSLSAGTSPLTFAPGETRKTLILDVVQDQFTEPGETAVFTLGTPVMAQLGAIPEHTVLILDLVSSPNTDIVPNPLVSPNGDGLGNDFFFIDGIVFFENEVIIYNRWGTEVFRMKNYNYTDRVFKGFANTGIRIGEILPEGVYYYLISTKTTVSNESAQSLNKGYLIIKR